MATYKIIVKQNKYCNGVKLEKGIEIQVASHSSPLKITVGKEEVMKAFTRNFGIDIKKNGDLTSVYLDVIKK